MTKPDLSLLLASADMDRANDLIVPLVELIDAAARISGGDVARFRRHVALGVLMSIADEQDPQRTPEYLADLARGAAELFLQKRREAGK